MEMPEAAAAFLDAASNLRVAEVRRMLADGADPNTADPWNRTALQLAVRHAYNGEDDALEVARMLIEAGAAVNPADDDGFTALTHAAIYGYPKLLAYLIEKGADVNHRGEEGQTALGMIEASSLAKRRKRIIGMLEEAGGVR